ncbi:MAG: threonylcarbamoyl-AMP synthase [Thermoprotei archaeon]|nr:MAG: threonylcarbamoyl-AMP synthase [Thermoprotei archaeon]RLE98858.1 MAG: threonylcarbamoyl-AMP synthase [Thermoprotei archaeon]
MRILLVKVDPLNPDTRLIAKVAKIVKQGGLVIYPTDTVYGLGADPFNVDAVRKVYEVKQRPREKPLPVLISEIKHLENLAYVTPEARTLARIFWPGALTIILKKKKNVPEIITCGRDIIAVRVPGHKVALALIECCGGALIGTSANLSGAPPPRTLEDALSQIGEKVDAAIDAGPCPAGLPSTILDLTKDPPLIVRKGPVKIEELEKALGKKIHQR